MKEKNNTFLTNKIVLISTIAAFLVIICGWLFITKLTNNSSIKKVSNDYYSLKYDKSWKLKEKKKDKILFKHGSGSTITVQITDVADNYRYSSIDELVDEVLYSLQEQNKSYKLLSTKKDKLTKFDFDGYKVLFENDKEQVMVYLYKSSDKLVVARFESANGYFDILLDSVQNIIYNLDIKDERYELKNKSYVKTTDMEYGTDIDFDNKIKKTKKHEIIGDHYYVEYTLPDIFTDKKIDSGSGWFEYKIDRYNSPITITSMILSRNIYDYFDEDEKSLGVYSSYETYKNNKSYSNFTESVDKLTGKRLGYIYKCNYLYKKAYDKNFKQYNRSDERAEIVYHISNNRILMINIEAQGVPITKKLVDSIKVNKVKNYATYTTNERDGNYLVGTLKQFVNYDYDKIEVIKIKVPDKYQEYQEYNDNIYAYRFYGLNLNEKINKYDYEVHYFREDLDADKEVQIYNDTYVSDTFGEAHKLTYTGDLTLNGKVFKVYDGGSYELSGIMFTDVNRSLYYVNRKILFYPISDKGGLFIQINGNGKEITNEILNEITNFSVEEIKN